MTNQAGNLVKSIVTTFEILRALREMDGAGVTELAEQLSLPKNSAYNYLSTLEQEEYVVKVESEICS